MGINVRFADDDWERHARNWSAWWEGALDRPLVMIEAKVADVPFEPFVNNLPLGLSTDAILDHYQAHLEALRFFGDAWPRWRPNFGPIIVAGFLGAGVHAAADTIWFSPLQATRLEDLRLAYDPDNAWWRRVQDLTRAAVARWGDRVLVAHTSMGNNLDILAALRGTQQLLFDLCDAPDEVERLAGEVTRAWLRFYDEHTAVIEQAGRGTTPWAHIWSPGRCYMLQCDFAYMISPAMFERFVMPDLKASCAALDHPFYHMDGKGQIPHLDMLLSLERLRGIQWVPGDGAPPPEAWLPLLKRIRDAGKLCQLYVSAAGAREIVRALGGRGFALYIENHNFKTAAEAADFLKVLAAEDASA